MNSRTGKFAHILADDINYERLRLENIQRNEEYLQQLGFTKNKRILRSNIQEKFDTKNKRNKLNDIVDTPSRRSSRVAQLPQISYIESSIPLHRRKNGQEFDPSHTLIDGDLTMGTVLGLEDKDNDDKGEDLKSQVVPMHSNSDRCADLCADLGYFLGDMNVNNNAIKCETQRSHRLCESVHSYGKAAVMTLANKGQLPRFSKYSGALEWSNCLFLWVNLGGTSGYANAFSEGGRYMMWFGGSKMHKDSSIVKRLIKAGAVTVTTKSTTAGPEPVLLFARREGEAYCCLGRVRWVAADLISSPVQFKWELIDLPLFDKTAQFKLLRDAS